MFRWINYDRSGKGIDPNAPKKKPFFQFFELYFRKFFSLMQLNLMFLVCCIPIFTIGPATAGMTGILRNFSEEKPVFLWADFKKTMKRNFKQGFLVWLINLFLWLLLGIDGLLLYTRPSVFSMIVLGLLGIIAIVFAMMQLYLYPLMVSYQYTILDLYKNAFLLALGHIYGNLLILAAVFLISWAVYALPMLSLFLLAFLYFSTIAFLSVFYAQSVLKKSF